MLINTQTELDVYPSYANQFIIFFLSINSTSFSLASCLAASVNVLFVITPA